MVTVRFYAGARAAAGRAEQEVPASTLDALLGELARSHGEKLASVLARSSYLVDGVACHDRTAPLPAGATVDVLPPFAGG